MYCAHSKCQIFVSHLSESRFFNHCLEFFLKGNHNYWFVIRIYASSSPKTVKIYSLPDLEIVWCSQLNTGKVSTGLLSAVPIQESLEKNTGRTTWNGSFSYEVHTLSNVKLAGKQQTTVMCHWAADWTQGTWSDRPASVHGTLPPTPAIW